VLFPLSRDFEVNRVGGHVALLTYCTSNFSEEVRMQRIKVLIVDDHAEMRRVIRDFLNTTASVVVVGEAVDGIDAIDKTEELNPDVVLMDISMPQRDGLEATRIIKERWPTTTVVIASMHDSPQYRQRAAEVKADRFITKSSLKPDLEAMFGRSL
jgi:DNA-binding NarL/FixJ family response regulator